MAVAPLKIADREFTSRLILGTGKFASPELMRDALEASGTEIVTVALRRASLNQVRITSSVTVARGDTDPAIAD